MEQKRRHQRTVWTRISQSVVMQGRLSWFEHVERNKDADWMKHSMTTQTAGCWNKTDKSSKTAVCLKVITLSLLLCEYR